MAGSKNKGDTAAMAGWPIALGWLALGAKPASHLNANVNS
jgi:hypothetical protein